jgi:O-succinylbenzoic acid--CoA ligase
MSITLLAVEGADDDLAAALERAWERGWMVALAAAAERQRCGRAVAGPAAAEALAGLGAGVVVGSGGSSGGRRWCVQPLSHLEASAAATAAWLRRQGIDPAACLHLNPLPPHHVSGLLPRVRARLWGARHGPVPAEAMRRPSLLAEAVPLPAAGPTLLSLVPTQLGRLLAAPEGVAWLRRLAMIWVGGAPLPPPLAARARAAGLPLAPCYGATETAAMVCALPPAAFLEGREGCGPALADCALRIDPATEAVEVRSDRLSPGWLAAGRLVPLPRTADGWWRSGDAGRLGPAGLVVRGRLDGAIHSGGETVFPEQLEERLRRQAAAAALPLRELLLVPEPDPLWGERLVALVRPRAESAAAPGQDALLADLEALCRSWPAAERPRRWLLCPQLAPSDTGKWQRPRWRRWAAAQSG